MANNRYIGARYVPIFSGAWDNKKSYEPLMIVEYQGNSYTSKTYVPVGADIGNTSYWALTGNYNAQVEAYRKEVVELTNRVNSYQTLLNNINYEVSTNKSDINVLKQNVVTLNNDLDDIVNALIPDLDSRVDIVEDNIKNASDRIATLESDKAVKSFEIIPSEYATGLNLDNVAVYKSGQYCYLYIEVGLTKNDSSTQVGGLQSLGQLPDEITPKANSIATLVDENGFLYAIRVNAYSKEINYEIIKPKYVDGSPADSSNISKARFKGILPFID